jgi:hypothetical protein
VDRFQRLAPAVDGGDDFVGVGGPDEGLGVVVGLVEVAVDGGLEIDDAEEGASSEPSLGEGSEEASLSNDPQFAAKVRDMPERNATGLGRAVVQNSGHSWRFGECSNSRAIERP